MINGTTDTFFPADTTVRPLQRLAGDPHEFVWIELGHETGGSSEAQAALMSWLSKTFPQ